MTHRPLFLETRQLFEHVSVWLTSTTSLISLKQRLIFFRLRKSVSSCRRNALSHSGPFKMNKSTTIFSLGREGEGVNQLVKSVHRTFST